MRKNLGSVLIVGFNTRPIAYSLHLAGYKVYAVDFFGDLDLYPYVEDCIIISKSLHSNYDALKDSYHQYLVKFALELLEKVSNIDYLIIGSGLDDAYNEREHFQAEIRKKGYRIQNANNDLDVIKKARNIHYVYDLLLNLDYKIPYTTKYADLNKFLQQVKYPFILKKIRSSGGLNVLKIIDESSLKLNLSLLHNKDFNPSEWVIQEYIEGIPVSCTVISNGTESRLISINRQIIGEKYLNSPKEFMYCGNVVPANLQKNLNQRIVDISIGLTNKLKLKGINGFDFVLKGNQPYLMEINPRIPGSIRASELAMDLNLLNLHIQSFDPNKWTYIINKLKESFSETFATKLIFFSPRELDLDKIKQINELDNVHDKSDPNNIILKNDPVCTILYKAKTFAESYFGALKIVDEINKIIR